jgi:hypothetical protein
MSTLTVLRTNAGLFTRAVVGNQDLPEARRANKRWCDGEGTFTLHVAGHARDLTVRCHAFDAEHTAFDAATAIGPEPLELEWTLLEELPRGHIGVARQLDEANHVRAYALLKRDASRLNVLPPSHALWSVTAHASQPWLFATLCALLIALTLRAAHLWKRRTTQAAPGMTLHRASDTPKQVQVINPSARAAAPVDDTASSA